MKILNVIGLVSITLALFSCEDNYDMSQVENQAIGHAWIASGGTYMNGDVEYYVYTFREKFDFYPVYKYVDRGMQYYYFYMNWGWYGGYNGSYLDTAKDPVYGEEITDRRDIYGIEPNN